MSVPQLARMLGAHRYLRLPWWSLSLLGIWMLACLPLAVTDFLPLVDYPGHLARVHLLARWDDLPGYGQYYQPHWAVLPNLALELVAVPLAMLLPATTAVRLFCMIALGLMILGGARLNRAVGGRWTVWSFAPALLVYNYILAFGFLNFIFGAGVCLIALGSHITGRERPTHVRAVQEVGFCSVLFFCHLVALATYLFAAGVYEGAAGLRNRAVWRHFACEYALLLSALLVPLILLSFSPTRAEAGGFEFRSLSSKVLDAAGMFRTGQGLWDHLYALATVVGIGILIGLRQFRINVPLAIVTLGLAILFVLAPFSTSTVSNFDARLPLIPLFIALASLETRSTKSAAVLAVLVPLFLFRIGITTIHYARSGEKLAQVSADLRTVPSGSLLFTSAGSSAAIYKTREWRPPLLHASALLLLDRPVFASLLFTEPSQQPLVRTRAFAALGGGDQIKDPPEPIDDQFVRRLQAKIETAGRTEVAYLFYVKGGAPAASTRLLDTVLERPRYILYRLREAARTSVQR